jgi:hypothetical protein
MLAGSGTEVNGSLSDPPSWNPLDLINMLLKILVSVFPFRAARVKVKVTDAPVPVPPVGFPPPL